MKAWFGDVIIWLTKPTKTVNKTLTTIKNSDSIEIAGVTKIWGDRQKVQASRLDCSN
jgi:hypothetical protein